MLNLAALELHSSFFSFTVFLFIVALIGTCLVCASMIFSKTNADAQKLAVFESGFQPYSTARQKFNIQFFIVAILFILFDLELIFLVPFAVNFFKLQNPIAILTITLFFILLVFGIIFELAAGIFPIIPINKK